jgi:hypothetical protein
MEINPDWSFLFPAALLLLLLVLFVSQIWRKTGYPYHSKNTLLSAGELVFYHALHKAISPQQMIAPKVRLGDVIGCSEMDWSRGHGPRISAKHLDFVLIDRLTSRILLAIELDDRSHERPDRKARDVFLNLALEAAQVPLLRIPAARSYNPDQIRTAIEAAPRYESKFKH